MLTWLAVLKGGVIPVMLQSEEVLSLSIFEAQS